MASLPSSYDIERNPGYAFISHGISGYAGSPIRNKGTWVLSMFSVHRGSSSQEFAFSNNDDSRKTWAS